MNLVSGSVSGTPGGARNAKRRSVSKPLPAASRGGGPANRPTRSSQADAGIPPIIRSAKSYSKDATPFRWKDSQPSCRIRRGKSVSATIHSSPSLLHISGPFPYSKLMLAPDCLPVSLDSF
jgi:hypothetical protein